MKTLSMTSAAIVMAAGAGYTLADVVYPNRYELGMNLSELSPGITQWPLNDLFKSSSDWFVPQGAASPSGYTADGYPVLSQPNEEASTFIYQGGSLPPGNYTLAWSGQGSIQLGTDSATLVHSAGGTNSVQIALTPKNAAQLTIVGSNPIDPVRDIHFYMPGTAPGQANGGQTFNSTFTQGLAPFGTLRFMNMMPTNDPITSWNQRSLPTAARWTDTGMPVEQMVQLANQTHSNPWFTLPPRADATYIENFAAYVAQHLDPSLKVYVESGNESWSPANDAYQYFQQQINQANGTTGKFYRNWAPQWAADTAQAFAAFETGFNNSSRVVRVAAVQTENRYDSPIFLDSLHGQFDAIGIAPYISGNGGKYNAATTKEQILADMVQSIKDNANTALFPWGAPMGDWVFFDDLAKSYSQELNRSIGLLGYEGGQSLAPNSLDVPWYQAYVDAQRDPALKEVYTTLLSTWFNQIGGGVLNQFKYVGPIGEYGAWGALEYQNQNPADAPKFQSLVNFAATPEPMTAALLFPGTLLLLRRKKRI